MALRSCIIGIGSDSCDRLQLVDMWSRKQRRVCRSTFSAELRNVAEVAEEGMFLAGFYEEVWKGAQSASAIADKLQSARLAVPVRVYLDAKSVFTAIASADQNTITERHLLYELKALRDHITSGRINSITWIDTIDMLCDALTKGKIPREALLEALRTGTWKLRKDHESWPKHRPKRVTFQ